MLYRHLYIIQAAPCTGCYISTRRLHFASCKTKGIKVISCASPCRPNFSKLVFLDRYRSQGLLFSRPRREEGNPKRLCRCVVYMKQTLYGNTIVRINIGSCSRGCDSVNVTWPSMYWRPWANNLAREKGEIYSVIPYRQYRHV